MVGLMAEADIARRVVEPSPKQIFERVRPIMHVNAHGCFVQISERVPGKLYDFLLLFEGI